jgi:GNAT superfamily N-acetyltransferase
MKIDKLIGEARECYSISQEDYPRDTCSISGNRDVFSIIPYDRKYRDDMLFCYLAAKDAIGDYAPEEWKRPTLSDDLLDIENTYYKRGDVFYLAINEHDRVVGMIGTQSISPTDLLLKRLFIKPEHKGRGIGSKLLSVIEEYAKGKGIATLHTRFAYWYREAAVFYPAKGFVEQEPDNHLRIMIKALK